MAITLAELKQAARERADMESSNFVTDSELTTYLNGSIAELHDIVVQSYGEDYYIKDITFTTTASQKEYNLVDIITDNDLYKIRGVDAQLNGDDFFTLKPFNFNERNRFQNFGVWDYLGITNVRYRLMGSRLLFSPPPDSSITVKIWYVPVAAKLSDDTDTLDDINQYSEYVIVDAAIKMLNKQESDVTVLMAYKQELKRRIEEASNNRDVGDPQSVQDIYVENSDIYYGRTRS